MEKLKKAESVLLGWESALLAGILIFLIVMSFTQVLLRQFFGGGILWCDTVLRHLVLWVGFLGAARAAAEGKHFAFEALSDRLPPRWRSASRALACLGAVAVSLLLTRASWAFMTEERAAANTLLSIGGWAVPAWPFALILPIGFTLVALHSALRLWLGPIPEEGTAP